MSLVQLVRRHLKVTFYLFIEMDWTKGKDQLDDLVAKLDDCCKNATHLMYSTVENSEVLPVVKNKFSL